MKNIMTSLFLTSADNAIDGMYNTMTEIQKWIGIAMGVIVFFGIIGLAFGTFWAKKHEEQEKEIQGKLKNYVVGLVLFLSAGLIAEVVIAIAKSNI